MSTRGSYAQLIPEQKLTITPIHDPGLMFAHEKTAWLHQGSWHLVINTTKNYKEDFYILEDCIEKLRTTCEKAMQKNYRIDCEDLVDNFEWRVKYIQQTISGLLKSRTKRNRGILSFLQDLLFGNSEMEEIETIEKNQRQLAKRVSGTMAATIDGVNKIQNATDERLKMYNDKINTVINFLNNERSLSDNSFMKVQLMHTLEMAKAIADDIWLHYEKMSDLSIITEEEIRSLILQVKSKLPATATIHEAFNQQSNLHLCRHKLELEDENVMIILHIPIINSLHYEIFQIISIPDVIHQKIIRVPQEYIGVNHESLSFFYPELPKYLIEINEGEWIYENTIVNSNLPALDCAAASVFRKPDLMRARCKTEILPKEYDTWIALPGINKYIYYTTHKHETAIICNATRTEVEYSTAMVTLAPKCYVQTTTKRIYASTDLSSKQFKTFLHPQVLHVELNVENTVDPINTISVESITENLSNLKDEIKTITIEDHVGGSLNMNHVVGISTSIVGLMVIIAVVGLVCYIKLKRQRIESNRHSQSIFYRDQRQKTVPTVVKRKPNPDRKKESQNIRVVARTKGKVNEPFTEEVVADSLV